MFLTKKQHRLLEFLKEFRQEKGYSPTLEEMSVYFGVSKITMHEHVSALVRKGAITRARHRARAIEFPGEQDGSRPPSFPLCGTIQAGAPIQAIEKTETVVLDDLFKARRSCYLLRVKGDSMIDEQIRDGDYVLVEQRRTARNGETVVALLETGEATLKAYFKEKSRIRLQPANKKMKPIYAQEVRIQGVVVGVLRRY
ncbi:MAG: transcriptional repressor LexA [Planctomycetes bacterium]|nr:transcriptional repressor LexA [Planctomycetota bacterium]